MSDRHKALAIALYAAIGIFTFGHAARQQEERDQAEYAECRARPMPNYCFNGRNGGLAGMFSAPLWPLYWAWELQP